MLVGSNPSPAQRGRLTPHQLTTALHDNDDEAVVNCGSTPSTFRVRSPDYQLTRRVHLGCERPQPTCSRESRSHTSIGISELPTSEMSDTPPSHPWVTSVPLRTFTVFPNLPFELRILVWQHTLEPRVIEVSYDEGDGFSTYSRNPDALQICKESRKQVINQYPLCFGSIFHPPRIRMNFALDTLYLDMALEEEIPHFFATFRECELSGLRSLALDVLYTESMVGDASYDLTQGFKSAIKALRGLKELLFVFDIEELSMRSIGCGEDHALQLFHSVPAELQHPYWGISEDNPLEIPGDLMKARTWDVPTCKAVYGWRRCPGGVDLPLYDHDFDDDVEDIDQRGMAWHTHENFGLGAMFGMGMGMDEDDVYDSDNWTDDDDGIEVDMDEDSSDIADDSGSLD